MEAFTAAMSTMRHLDPEFLRPQEMNMAYASQVHHIPNLPTSAPNIGMQPGMSLHNADESKPSVNKLKPFMTQEDPDTCLLTSLTSTRILFRPSTIGGQNHGWSLEDESDGGHTAMVWGDRCWFGGQVSA